MNAKSEKFFAGASGIGPDGHPPEPDPKPRRELPAFDDAADLAGANLPTPAAVVADLLRRGEKAVLGGASKTFKSWAALDLAFCVSHGRRWLGRDVTQGRVIFANLELPKWCIVKRLLDIAAAHGVPLQPGRLILWNLRGLNVKAEEVRDTLHERVPKDLALAVIDPAYKLLHGRDENSAADVADLLNCFEQITADTEAAVLIPVHFAKGNASGKESQDRISGSGVFARDPDSIFTLTRHETEDAFTVESTLRTFPPAPPFVVRWSHPLFSVDGSLDPAKLKKARPGPPAKFTPEKLLALLPAAGLSKPDWRAKAEAKNGMGKSKFYDLCEQLENTGKVVCGEDGICRPVTTETQKPYAD